MFTRIKQWRAFNRALADYKSGNYSTAFHEFEKLANAGHPMAQYYLGSMYNSGQGTPVDFKKASEWIRKSGIMSRSDVPTAGALLAEDGGHRFARADEGFRILPLIMISTNGISRLNQANRQCFA